MMTDLKLGKKPFVPDDRDLKLATYLKTNVLPKHPASFGHETLIPTTQWGMLGNDRAGDCVFAGGGHETMMWNKEAGVDTVFSTTNTLADYSAVTGYNPRDPSTDQGTITRDALSYRQKTGLLDAKGKRHKIAVYAAIDPKDWTTMMTALYLFGAVGIGIEFPESAMSQFNAGKSWTVVKGSKIEGGHYIPLVGHRTSTKLVTWGKCISATQAFIQTYCDEAWACISEEALIQGRSLEGFDDKALIADLKSVTK